MDLHEIARIIRGLEAEGWDSKRILNFIIGLGNGNEQPEPELNSIKEEKS